MRRFVSSALVAACLVGTLTAASPAVAGASNAHLAKSSCTQMGVSVASLRPYFGKVAITWAGYECGINGSGVAVTLYLFPISDKASEMVSINFSHAKPLGGLGPGAKYASFAGGDYNLALSRGTRFVYIDGQLLASKGKLIALAHLIYRALG